LHARRIARESLSRRNCRRFLATKAQISFPELVEEHRKRPGNNTAATTDEFFSLTSFHPGDLEKDAETHFLCRRLAL
jgi:hypothetical protein